MPESLETARKNGVSHWSGPNGFRLLSWEVDFRRSSSRLCLATPDGPEYWVEDANLEIVEPERIVFTGIPGVVDEPSSDKPETVTFRRM